MAYEVTKRIKGHLYRYLVEGYRDPVTRKQRSRWRYLGAVADGKVVQSETRHKNRIGREAIIDVTARLLEHRDPGNVTVSVIASAIGASPSTFYRYFPNRKSALAAALSRMCDDVIQTLPPLDAPLRGGRDEARERLRVWCEALYRSMMQQRALRWAISQGHLGALRARMERSLITTDSSPMLSGFLQKLSDAGLAAIEDSDGLVQSIRAATLAMLQASVANPETGSFPRPEYSEIFPLIDRAVFGPNCTATQKDP